jgi:hypothetical protein
MSRSNSAESSSNIENPANNLEESTNRKGRSAVLQLCLKQNTPLVMISLTAPSATARRPSREARAVLAEAAPNPGWPLARA